MIRLARPVEAEQWAGEGCPLPVDTHLCQPEVCYSADKNLVYFTYAGLPARNWLEMMQRPITIEKPELEFMVSGIEVKLKDGSHYWRKIYPFAFYEIKSLSSMTRNWRAIYLDRNNAPLVRAFLDYCDLENWGEVDDKGNRCLPPRAEHRIVNGSYGRGFKPIYLSPGDWLVRETGREPYVLSDKEFQQLRVAAIG